MITGHHSAFAALCRTVERSTFDDFTKDVIKRATVYCFSGPSQHRLDVASEWKFNQLPLPSIDEPVVFNYGQHDGGVMQCVAFFATKTEYHILNVFSDDGKWSKVHGYVTFSMVGEDVEAINVTLLSKMEYDDKPMEKSHLAKYNKYPRIQHLISEIDKNNEEYRKLTNEFDEMAKKIIAEEIRISLLTWAYINMPHHHIVCERPHSADRRQNSPKIPRLADREVTRIIKPEEIKKVYPALPSSQTGRTVAPHKRRGHVRVLRSERYKEKRGQTIWVAPMWVGPNEWSDQKVTYRVLQSKGT